MQHKLRLLDHLVGAAEQRKRARNPKRLGSFEVKYQLDFDGLLYYSAAIDPGVFAREAILRRTMSM